MNDELNKLWEAIDPCAYLCYCVQVDKLPFDDSIKKTLDAFGWLNTDGFPDYGKMNREFARIQHDH